MAKARFHSIRGEKSALILVQKNALEFSLTPVYVPRAGVEAFSNESIDTIKEGTEFEIPDGYTLVDIIDTDTGEVRTTKEGIPLKQLQY